MKQKRAKIKYQISNNSYSNGSNCINFKENLLLREYLMKKHTLRPARVTELVSRFINMRLPLYETKMVLHDRVSELFSKYSFLFKTLNLLVFYGFQGKSIQIS